MYRRVLPKVAEYIDFSNIDGTFSRIDHMLHHKTNFSESKKIEIVLSIFSNHNDGWPSVKESETPEMPFQSLGQEDP